MLQVQKPRISNRKIFAFISKPQVPGLYSHPTYETQSLMVRMVHIARAAYLPPNFL